MFGSASFLELHSTKEKLGRLKFYLLVNQSIGRWGNEHLWHDVALSFYSAHLEFIFWSCRVEECSSRVKKLLSSLQYYFLPKHSGRDKTPQRPTVTSYMRRNIYCWTEHICPLYLLASAFPASRESTQQVPCADPYDHRHL